MQKETGDRPSKTEAKKVHFVFYFYSSCVWFLVWRELLEGNKDDEKAKLTLLSSTLYSRSKSESKLSLHEDGYVHDGEYDLQISSFFFNWIAFLSYGQVDSISQWEVSSKELEIDRNQKLGSGAFGDVYMGKFRGKTVAIKKLLFQELDDDSMDDFKKEVSMMTWGIITLLKTDSLLLSSKLRHPNVLLFMGACTAPGSLSMSNFITHFFLCSSPKLSL